MVDALSRLPNHTEPARILDQTCDVHMVVYNLNGYRVYEYLLKGVMPKRFTTSQRHYLAQRAKPFML